MSLYRNQQGYTLLMLTLCMMITMLCLYAISTEQALSLSGHQAYTERLKAYQNASEKQSELFKGYGSTILNHRAHGVESACRGRGLCSHTKKNEMCIYWDMTLVVAFGAQNQGQARVRIGYQTPDLRNIKMSLNQDACQWLKSDKHPTFRRSFYSF